VGRFFEKSTNQRIGLWREKRRQKLLKVGERGREAVEKGHVRESGKKLAGAEKGQVELPYQLALGE